MGRGCRPRAPGGPARPPRLRCRRAGRRTTRAPGRRPAQRPSQRGGRRLSGRSGPEASSASRPSPTSMAASETAPAAATGSTVMTCARLPAPAPGRPPHRRSGGRRRGQLECAHVAGRGRERGPQHGDGPDEERGRRAHGDVDRPRRQPECGRIEHPARRADHDGHEDGSRAAGPVDAVGEASEPHQATARLGRRLGHGRAPYAASARAARSRPRSAPP